MAKGEYSKVALQRKEIKNKEKKKEKDTDLGNCLIHCKMGVATDHLQVFVVLLAMDV